MITINGQNFRNLEEQVLKNTQDIANHYNVERVLADFGIKVVGQVNTPDLLPDPATFSGDYGDAYAVGAVAPYSFYIWTRAHEASGHPSDYWLDIGPLAIVGPQGPRGPQGNIGERGIRGSQWFSAGTAPEKYAVSGYNDGDYLLVPQTGNIYHVHTIDGIKQWVEEGNIKGPQGNVGPQGPQGAQGPAGPTGDVGPAGPAGPLVDILGTINSVDELPDPTTVPRQAAYLLRVVSGSLTSYTVYAIVGTDDNLQWADLGKFAAGTQVTRYGSAVDTWNADQVVYRPTSTNPNYMRALTNAAGTTAISYTNATVDASPTLGGASSIPVRTEEGVLRGMYNYNTANSTDLVNHAGLRTALANAVAGGTYIHYITLIEYDTEPYGEHPNRMELMVRYISSDSTPLTTTASIIQAGITSSEKPKVLSVAGYVNTSEILDGVDLHAIASFSYSPALGTLSVGYISAYPDNGVLTPAYHTLTGNTLVSDTVEQI